MKTFSRALFSLLLLAVAHGAAAQESSARQEHDALRRVAEQFLRTQSAGLPGQVNIRVGQIDSRLQLAACAAPEAFLPPGSKVWGKTTIGLRCAAPSPWTVYVGATVQVIGEYLVTAAPLVQGQQIGNEHLAKVKGDLTALPPGIVTDASQALGRSPVMSLRAGMPLRQDILRSPSVVQQGQVIRVVSGGPGFQVTAEARSLTNAAAGQVAQARTASGQVVSGIARAGGVVEVTY
ncbi:flagellar basal body P-ring formation chaperone FlgA [Noviherbaspirillum massiliense]|uniref:flagellar basal body P-ring formation chaperone FlgA n=1 Tax=Noviherbaspirillum massiliense TaxID=1465823 RepID=UPI00038255FB|nr:flagellar basal body P-ring formation chaperone FlgA [Noviherbaspirillum massiliense]